MCEYCHSFPHLSGCPCAPDPKAVYKCAHCGAEIYEGDEYYEIDGIPYCENCLYGGAYDYAATQVKYHHNAVVEEYPRFIATCSGCKEQILSDEEYDVLEINGDTCYYHTECLYELASEIFDSDIKRCTAEETEIVPEYEPEFD